MPEFDEVKDSGERQQWDTGSQRDSQEGKGRFDLIPFLPIERLAQHFENGAKKYDDDNWKKGQNLRQYINSAFRHLYKLSEGWDDEDHAAAVMWNAAAFIWTADAIERGVLPAELDDIPGGFTTPGVSEELRSWAGETIQTVHIPNISVDAIDLLAGGGMRIQGHAEPVETPVYTTGNAESVEALADAAERYGPGDATIYDATGGPQSTGEGLEEPMYRCAPGCDGWAHEEKVRDIERTEFTSAKQRDEFRRRLGHPAYGGHQLMRIVEGVKLDFGFLLHDHESDAPK